jgi:hypothetical protein
MSKTTNNPFANLIPQTIYLSEKDMEFFLGQLEKTPFPNERLKALLRGETYIDPDCKPHIYDADTTSGLGFCKICYTDDGAHPIHIKE